MNEHFWVIEIWALYKNPDNEMFADDIMRAMEKRVRVSGLTEPKPAGFKPGCFSSEYRSIIFPEFAGVAEFLELAGRYRKVVPWDKAGSQVLSVELAAYPLKEVNGNCKGIDIYWPGAAHGAVIPVQPTRLHATHPKTGEVWIEYSSKTKERAKDLAISILSNRVLFGKLRQKWYMEDADSAAEYRRWCLLD